MGKHPHVAMTNPDAVHCMVDIETLGSADDAPIVQIAAVMFNPWGTARALAGAAEGGGIISAPGGEFNWHVKIEGPIDPDTLLWWFAQGQQAQERVFARGLERFSLRYVLGEFAGWSRHIWERPVDFWWSDMDFDLRLMRAAWKRSDLLGSAPYGSDDGPHRGVRDCRTVRAIGRDLGIEPPLFVGVVHDALDDAHHQVIEVSNILRAVHGAKDS